MVWDVFLLAPPPFSHLAESSYLIGGKNERWDITGVDTETLVRTENPSGLVPHINGSQVGSTIFILSYYSCWQQGMTGDAFLAWVLKNKGNWRKSKSMWVCVWINSRNSQVKFFLLFELLLGCIIVYVSSMKSYQLYYHINYYHVCLNPLLKSKLNSSHCQFLSFKFLTLLKLHESLGIKPLSLLYFRGHL